MSLRQKLKNILPEISKTEQEALDAGTVWVEGSIFQGKPDFDKLLSYEPNKLSSEEQAFFDGPLQELLEMIDEQEIQKSNHLPTKILDFLRANKFFTFIIPKKFGGLEFSNYANSTIVATIATRSSAVAITVMVPNSLGCGELLAHYGTEEQQDHYLPRLVNGTDIPCFALTSPEAGSDAGGIPDKGIITKKIVNGEEVLGLSCTWDKRYITLAPISTLAGLAIKVFDPEGLLGKEKDLGITCVLVPSDTDGAEFGNRHKPMGVNFYNGTTRGKDVFIPLDNVIGGAKNIGNGWRMLVECLSAGRIVSLPANGTAICHAAFKSTSEYAAIREQFGLPIGKFEGIQEQLALIGGLTFNAEAMRHATLTSVDDGAKPSVLSAMAKYHLTETGRTVLTAAMDVQAGKAIQEGPKNVLATAHKAIPIMITVEGANILTRNLMIFGQGATRCHPYVQELIAAIHSEDSDADSRVNNLMKKTVIYSAKNFFRGFGQAYIPTLGAGKSALKEVRHFEKRINRLSSALAVNADFAMLVLGGDLKRKEMLSARLGDVMSYLFMAMSNVKFYVQSKNRSELTHYFNYGTAHALGKAEDALLAFIDNFPNRVVANTLKVSLGIPFMSRTKISDKMITDLAEETMKNNGAKAELTHLVKVQPGDGYSELQVAFEAKLAVMPLLKKLQGLVRAGTIDKQLTFGDLVAVAFEGKHISESEQDALNDYNIKRKIAIDVDEYDNDMNLLDMSAQPDIKLAKAS
jgi:acyl-CoA dehydrogenase